MDAHSTAEPRADDLLPIGRFARLSGLSVGALRHYDELDLLRPANVDPFTGYRRYRRDQLDEALLVARLRDLEMPLGEIRTVLAADDPAERRRIVEVHRDRVQARATRLHWVLHQLRVFDRSGTKEDLMSTPPMPPEIDPATRRSLAAGLFNRVWQLLETAERTPEQDDEMLHAAHASRYHWGEVGDAGNRAVGEWQCSRVYAVLGRGEPALHHARRCLAILEEAHITDWHVASAYEALARASAVAGDAGAAAEWKAKAQAAVARIEDADDREVIEQDLATLPV